MARVRRGEGSDEVIEVGAPSYGRLCQSLYGLAFILNEMGTIGVTSAAVKKDIGAAAEVGTQSGNCGRHRCSS